MREHSCIVQSLFRCIGRASLHRPGPVRMHMPRPSIPACTCHPLGPLRCHKSRFALREHSCIVQSLFRCIGRASLHRPGPVRMHMPRPSIPACPCHPLGPLRCRKSMCRCPALAHALFHHWDHIGTTLGPQWDHPVGPHWDHNGTTPWDHIRTTMGPPRGTHWDHIGTTHIGTTLGPPMPCVSIPALSSPCSDA